MIRKKKTLKLSDLVKVNKNSVTRKPWINPILKREKNPNQINTKTHNIMNTYNRVHNAGASMPSGFSMCFCAVRISDDTRTSNLTSKKADHGQTVVLEWGQYKKSIPFMLLCLQKVVRRNILCRVVIPIGTYNWPKRENNLQDSFIPTYSVFLEDTTPLFLTIFFFPSFRLSRLPLASSYSVTSTISGTGI